MPSSIQIQGTLLNTSFSSMLQQAPILGNSPSNGKIYVKQSASLRINKLASTNLVSN